MKVVYTLWEELERDPTLDRDKPQLGLKRTHGLFCSRRVVGQHRRGRIGTNVVAGSIIYPISMYRR